MSFLLVGLAIFSPFGFARANENGLSLAQPLTLAWRYASAQTTDLTPVADNNAIFLPLTSGVLVALSVADGKLQWKAEVGGDFSAAPVADDRNLYIATRYSEPEQKHVHGTLRSVSKSTGLTHWMRTLQAPVTGGIAVNHKALFAAGTDGRLYAFDKANGQTLWAVQYTEEFSAQPLVVGNSVYFGSNAGMMRALETTSGTLQWEYKSGGPIKGAIDVKDHIAYFGSGDGYVYAFNEIRSKLQWRRRTGAAVNSVAIVENGVLASSLDNFAYLLSLNGSLVWRRQLPGRISSRPITADDGALFTPFSTDSAIVLSLRDGKTENTLPLGEENSSAAAPISVNNLVLITVPHGLLAFAAPRQK